MSDVLLNTAAAAGSSGFALRDALPLAPAAVAIAALWLSDISNKRTAWQKTNETELKVIQDRLDGFYGPFRTLSDVNKLMNRDLRDRQADPKTFILIEKLFDKTWRAGVTSGEAALLKEVADNSKRLRAFIEKNVGMIDEKLLPYLSRAAAHYRMIELAFDKELGTDPAPFVKRYVFPRAVEDVLRLEVERLERRRDLLMTAPFKRPPPLKPLSIPAEYALPEWPNPPRVARDGLTVPLPS